MVLSSVSDRLSAQDLLTIKKVQEYVYDKLYGEKGDESGKDGRGSHIDILCAEQVNIPCIIGCSPQANNLLQFQVPVASNTGITSKS